MIGPLLAAAFLVVGARTGHPYLAIAALALSFGFQEFAEGTYWATTMDIGGRMTGSAAGILNTANNLGGVVSTALMPVLVAKVGWIHALDSCSLLAFVAAVLWLGVKADRPLDAHAPAAS
jgi:ACS family glucarate transporter-like MFS transporter